MDRIVHSLETLALASLLFYTSSWVTQLKLRNETVVRWILVFGLFRISPLKPAKLGALSMTLLQQQQQPPSSPHCSFDVTGKTRHCVATLHGCDIFTEGLAGAQGDSRGTYRAPAERLPSDAWPSHFQLQQTRQPATPSGERSLITAPADARRRSRKSAAAAAAAYSREWF
jgi:hypothetical protein